MSQHSKLSWRMRRPRPLWRVWRAAGALVGGVSPDGGDGGASPPHLPSSSLFFDPPSLRRYWALAGEAAGSLQSWGWHFASLSREGRGRGDGGNREYDWAEGLLKTPPLLNEVEESVVAINALAGWHHGIVLGGRPRKLECSSRPDGITVIIVDLCCGKGVFSMLLSYLAARRNSEECVPLRRVGHVVIVDRADIRWGHVSRVNANVVVGPSGDDELRGSGPCVHEHW